MTDEQALFNKHAESRSAAAAIPVIAAWARKDAFVRVDETGTITDVATLDTLPESCTQSLENRDQSTSV